MSRRLPVYILIDTSGSMRGEPIESVKVGLSDMIASLRLDPYALETVCVSIITFDSKVEQILPLTELEISSYLIFMCQTQVLHFWEQH